MGNGIKIKKSMAALIIMTGILTVVGIMLACAPPQARRTLPVSTWGDSYFYKYEPPETKPAVSVPVTLAIVNPKAAFDPVYEKVTKGLSKSMAIDLDKIIVAKGMTVTGPFENLYMMTYPDKKNADLSLTPEFLISIQSRDLTNWQGSEGWFVKSVEVKVDGWIVLMLVEPLSSEKIWIKKIEVGATTGTAEIYAEVLDMGPKPGYRYVRQYGPGNILYNGSKDAVANIINQMYPKIMQTAWNYLNTEEILILKEKAEEIRRLKRY